MAFNFRNDERKEYDHFKALPLNSMKACLPRETASNTIGEASFELQGHETSSERLIHNIARQSEQRTSALFQRSFAGIYSLFLQRNQVLNQDLPRLSAYPIIVEYTKLGNVRLSHEETNFQNINIPILQDGNMSEQLRQIFLIKDELLRNSKSLWATIILCFSFTRNIRSLFYKIKLTPQQSKHRNAMYFVWVIGFVWSIFYVSLEVGIKTFPQNIWLIPKEMLSWPYTINQGGAIFGLNMMYFAWGYIVVVSFLNYSNYIPDNFFDPIEKKEDFKIPTREERNNSVMKTFVGKRGETEVAGVDIVKIVHRDQSESRYYTKQQDYSFIVSIFRKYIRLLVPVLFASSGIHYALPFIADGPIYLVTLKDQFLIPCQGSWFLSFTFMQNLMHWSNKYLCESCFPYITDSFHGICGTNPTENDEFACRDQCGPYLSLFANIFQFYLLSMVIIICHKTYTKSSYVLILTLIYAASMVNFFLVQNKSINAFSLFDENYNRFLMHRPWFRLPSYLMGMLLGLVISRVHCARYEMQFKLLSQAPMQFLGICLCLASIFLSIFNFGPYQPSEMMKQRAAFNPLVGALYTSVSPIIFNIGMTLVILPSLLYTNQKNSSSLKADLSSLLMYDGWRILFKISQAAYICHYPVIFWYYATTYSNGYMINRWFLMRCSFGAYVLSFVVGILYYLTLDKPIRNLDRLVLFPSKISDSFLIKKTNRQVKKDLKAARKSKKTIVKNTRSTSKTGEGPAITIKEDSQEVDEVNQQLMSQAFSDESEDEHHATVKRAQQIFGSMAMSSFVRNPSFSHNQSFVYKDVPDRSIRNNSLYQGELALSKQSEEIKREKSLLYRQIDDTDNDETNKAAHQRFAAINSSFISESLISSAGENNSLSKRAVGQSKEFKNDDPYY